MAWSTLSSTLIEVGKAVKKEIFDTFKNNDDDHETRINALESGGAAKVVCFNEVIRGHLNDYSTVLLKNLNDYRVVTATNLLDAEITLLDANSSSGGTLEIDVQASSDDGVTWNSIFTVKPSITSSSVGDTSSTFTFNSTYSNLSANDIVRLDVSSLKDPQSIFQFRLYGELT